MLQEVNDGWKPLVHPSSPAAVSAPGWEEGSSGGEEDRDYVTICAVSSGPEQLVDYAIVDGDEVRG